MKQTLLGYLLQPLIQFTCCRMVKLCSKQGDGRDLIKKMVQETWSSKMIEKTW